MRAGDTFYLQLYAHTDGHDLTSFEVKLYENALACAPVPASGSFSTSYTGPLDGELSSTFQVEGLNRYVDPEDASTYFIKYSRLQKLDALESAHGHLGYIRMKMVGSGTCIVSASVTAFFYDGLDSFVPGVQLNDAFEVHGNELELYTDAAVGVFGQLNVKAPILNTAFLNGASLSIGVFSLLFSSPDAHASSAHTVSVPSSQGTGTMSVTEYVRAAPPHATETAIRPIQRAKMRGVETTSEA